MLTSHFLSRYQQWRRFGGSCRQRAVATVLLGALIFGATVMVSGLGFQKKLFADPHLLGHCLSVDSQLAPTAAAHPLTDLFGGAKVANPNSLSKASEARFLNGSLAVTDCPQVRFFLEMVSTDTEIHLDAADVSSLEHTISGAFLLNTGQSDPVSVRLNDDVWGVADVATHLSTANAIDDSVTVLGKLSGDMIPARVRGRVSGTKGPSVNGPTGNGPTDAVPAYPLASIPPTTTTKAEGTPTVSSVGGTLTGSFGGDGFRDAGEPAGVGSLDSDLFGGFDLLDGTGVLGSLGVDNVFALLNGEAVASMDSIGGVFEGSLLIDPLVQGSVAIDFGSHPLAGDGAILHSVAPRSIWDDIELFIPESDGCSLPPQLQTVSPQLPVWQGADLENGTELDPGLPGVTTHAFSEREWSPLAADTIDRRVLAGIALSLAISVGLAMAVALSSSSRKR